MVGGDQAEPGGLPEVRRRGTGDPRRSWEERSAEGPPQSSAGSRSVQACVETTARMEHLIIHRYQAQEPEGIASLH